MSQIPSNWVRSQLEHSAGLSVFGVDFSKMTRNEIAAILIWYLGHYGQSMEPLGRESWVCRDGCDDERNPP